MAKVIGNISCESCGKVEQIGNPMPTCPECNQVKYCNATCMQSHLSAHQEQCRSLPNGLHRMDQGYATQMASNYIDESTMTLVQGIPSSQSREMFVLIEEEKKQQSIVCLPDKSDPYSLPIRKKMEAMTKADQRLIVIVTKDKVSMATVRLVEEDDVHTTPNTPGPLNCWNCGQPNPTKRCSRCKEARYCNAQCQRKHWSFSHKGKCKPSS